MSENPLSEYFKKPGIYVKLPSEGNYYDDDIALSSTGEIEILPMSAKDEMHFKSPDALLNGESLIKVISNCIPGIKTPREIPLPDLSVILVGLRIATYGNDMNVYATCPGCENRDELTYDISRLLDNVSNITTNNTISIKEALVYAKPYTLALHTRIAIATHDEKIIQYAIEYAEEHNLTKKEYEFQMMYGIRRDIQKNLMQRGFTTRIYVPYGKSWYPYFMRRLAERPANLIFFLRNLVRI